VNGRELKSVAWRCVALDDLPGDQTALQGWLDAQATAYGLNYALVHADDGVIWGRFSEGHWRWSSEAFPEVSPKLRWVTLQQLRLFGPRAEVFVWRDDSQLKGRLIQDEETGAQECFDEAQLLWGRPHGEARNGFQMMREGAQGLLHAPPAEIAKKGRLATRNYIDYDADHCARVKASRLVVEQEN